jgi:anti-sigma B factor antagonist
MGFNDDTYPAAATSNKVGVGTLPTDGSMATPAPAGEDNADDLSMEVEGDLLRVRGDVDLYVAPVFQERALQHLHNSDAPRIDMTEVPFLDSAGLATLVTLFREAQKSSKTLRLAVGGSPRRVLRITGIDRMMNIEE